MITLNDNINAIIRARHCACGNDHYRDIMSYLTQTNVNKEGSTAPFINNLEIIKIFKDKDEEEEISITDLIY